MSPHTPFGIEAYTPTFLNEYIYIYIHMYELI